ncbi:MAG: M20 family metallopeptidase [candidate division NC10 bacterium]|nr:M20 family metallopeptidase [candidate division NC10 bacterium]
MKRRAVKERDWAVIIMGRAQEQKEDLVRIRRDLHQHPELAYREERTSQVVAERLAGLGLGVRTGVAKTGVVGLLNGKEQGKVIGIRVDMDALPIPDEKQCEYASDHPGVGHLCGHDAHTAIGLGAAAVLSSLRDQFSGSVKFLFQPAEESLDSQCPSGAQTMIQEGALEDPALDGLLGIHLWPEMPVNQVGIRSGAILTGLNLFQIRVKGRKSHTARSDLGVDAILIASHLVLALQSLVSREAHPSEPINLNIGRIEGGQAPNTLADEVILRCSIRASNPATGEELSEKLERIIGSTAAALRGEAHLDYRPYLPPLLNEERLTSLVEEAALQILPSQQVARLDLPRLAGDDFAYMAQRVPACYVFLGAGSEWKGIVYPSHHPLFDLDEDCLPVGVALLSLAAIRFLGQKEPPWPIVADSR